MKMHKLDPRATWLFFLNALIWFFFLYLFLVVIFGAFILSIFTGTGDSSLLMFELTSSLLILIGLIAFSFFWAKLTYNNYKYELREDGFRKEHGVIYKKYVTIPYERIQNVDIYRGILARLLGLSDLHIQTAGMSVGVGSYGGFAEGRLPGLSRDEAEKLRDELVKRAKGQGGL